MDHTETLDPAAMLGRVVGGRYSLEAVLGAGGMGAVFRARHRDLGSSAAVKILLTEDAEHAARFEREAASYWIRRDPPGPPPDTMRRQF